MPWLLVEGERKMLVEFAMVIEIASVPKTYQNKQLPDVPLSHNNHKRVLKRNVALISFVGRIATVITKR